MKSSPSKQKQKVFVAMSGGVDSSVAALLLKQQGYDVVGIFMKCWTGSSTRIYANFDAESRGMADECGWEKDAEDARRVAEHIGIPFYTLDFEEEYKKRVVDYMVYGYRTGITPNPDVMCNREIKFGLFLKRALSMGAEYVATGHYMKIEKSKIKNQNDKLKFKNIHKLLEARDSNKDQSYFLWTLTQDDLRHCLFPIGNYVKPEVRAIARNAGLPTAEKKDSQGICFLGKVSVPDFLKTYIREKRGDVVTVSGETIGEHRGAQFYTIGQRHIHMVNRRSTLTARGKTRKEDMRPLYVAEKNISANTIIVAEGNDHPALYKKEIQLTNVNFIHPLYSNVLKNIRIRVFARVRYRQPLALAFLAQRSKRQTTRKRGAQDAPGSPVINNYSLVFDNPQKFVAPGQSAVFYSKKGEMLGGGIIKT